MLSLLPSAADAVFALCLGAAGIPVGLATGRTVSLFHRHEPASEASGPPPPSCPRCDAEVGFARWAPVPRDYRLPVRGRCPACATPVGESVPTAVLTAATFALVGLTRGLEGAGRAPAETVALLFLCSVGVLLSVVDARVQRLPNALVFPSYVVALVLLATASGLSADAGPMVGALLGLVGLWAFYWLLWFIYPAGMGWGDVKLAGVLGLYLGWEGTGSVVSATFLASLLSASLGLVLILLGRATRKSRIPFGPFMVAGALAVILFGDPMSLLFS
ncbi:leader peptidase (prepilin peptidase)/N-methyltransferase [Haloactinospora alba]|uniref:Leader peptidase (Prepilin peptidase)/N-methyltransferase n=1 Tax=Haloactinospora alba TaxID=405555 RepID=A0A543NJL2_9ACTN|nr:A24 family peptidase [Haloactinospora alba]TQN32002.1 leader peptidase (prepilin peptidase)/N-methyltransferase [Haloactinospora alba]